MGRKLSFYIIMLGLAFGLPLVLGEVGLRLLLPQSHMTPRLVSSTAYGHALPRDTEMVETLPGSWRFVYSVNAMGYRGALVPTEESRKGTNILVLGDSYAFGEGVNDGEEFPAVLQDRLSDGYRVINLAVPGYGLTQQIRWYHDLGRDYRPAVVVLQFTNNDLWENQATPVTLIENGRFRFQDVRRRLAWLKDLLSDSFLQRSHLYNLIRASAFLLLTEGELTGTVAEDHDSLAPLASGYLALLELFVSELRQSGAAVFYLPVNRELDPYPLIRRRLEAMQRGGQLVLLPTDAWFENLEDFSSPEGHLWGAKAHRLVGERLAEALRALGPLKPAGEGS